MRLATRALWALTLLVLLASLASWLYRHPPSAGLAHSLEQARPLLAAATRLPFLLAAGLSAALAAGALVVERRAHRRTSALPQRAFISPLEVFNADVALAVREMIAELGQALRRLAEPAEPDMIALVDTLVEGAIRVGASDVHIHPLEQGTRVALRLHGVLEEVSTLPREHHARLINRFKVLARLVLYRSDKPQDGHFPFSTSEGQADIRLSLLPTNHGESVALRIARSGIRLPELAALGFSTDLLGRYQEALARPQGLILVAGATGSGKTTTLYASLGHIKRTRGDTTRIATIEDPVEFDVPLFAQTQVNPEQGFTFAQGLRSVLRQDPNVIMVGEIRDAETARTAIQAGLSGHLLLTTVHANSSAGVFSRLVEIGVEPFLLASASVASLSQRLVRALCPHCRAPGVPRNEQLARLQAAGLPTGPFFESTGCARCGNTGYLGRTAIHELLMVSPALREGIQARLSSPQLQEIAVREGMVPLLAAGVERAQAGATTLEEVFRVCG